MHIFFIERQVIYMEDIISVIITEEPNMSKKEKILAKYIQKNYPQIVNLSVHELASKSKVSAATIVRFCKRLKISGFPELKVKLSILAAQNEHSEYDEIHPGEEPEIIQKKMKTRFKSAIDATAERIDDHTIRKALKALYKASQIETFGVGSSALVAEDIYQKLLRIGKAISYQNDFHVAATQLVNLPKDSIFIVISNSGKTKEAIDLLKLAKRASVTSLAITSDEESKVAELADIVLLTTYIGEPMVRSGATTSLISQFFVVDDLLFNYISAYPNEIINKLKLSQEATRKYKNN